VSAQAKLLTFLDAGSYYRVGETEARKADVIVIGATNAKVSDLKNDLGPRFDAKVEVPPLRERVEDIPLIVRHLVLGMAEKSSDARRFVHDIKGGRYVKVSMRFMRELLRESYPGNTRELREMLRDAMLDTPEKSDTIDPPLDEVNVEDDAPLSNESQLLRTLKQTHWNQSAAAKLLGVSRFKVHRMMEDEGLKKP
jgi:two-component system response regulator HydG